MQAREGTQSDKERDKGREYKKVQRQGIKGSKAGKERHKGRPGKARREEKNNKGRQGKAQRQARNHPKVGKKDKKAHRQGKV